MKHIYTQSFDIDYPEIFSREFISLGDVILSNPDEEFQLQQPQMFIVLDKLSNLKEEDELEIHKDKNTEGLLHAYYQIKRQNIIENNNEQIKIQDKACYLQKAISKLTHKEQEVSFFHLFATVIIDETYILDITADCEIAHKQTYEPFFMQVIESLKLKGDYQQHYETMERELQLRLDKVDELLEENLPSIERLENSEQENQIKINSIEIPVFKIPEDGKTLFEVGDYSFDLTDGEVEFNISDFSHSFGVKIHHVPKQNEKLAKAVEDELLSDYIEHIGFDFQLKQVFNNYIPTGYFEFEEGKTNAPLFLHIYCRGFEYSLDFFGSVELRDGWLGINGYLKPPYNDTPVFMVKVYSKIDLEKLDWGNYTFNYEEALQAKPDDVRFLYIEKPSFTELPKEVLEYTQLQTLTIWGNHEYPNPENSYSPLNKIPKAISKLKQLESLSITNTCIKELPNSIGELKGLTSLHFSNNKLTEIPESICQLPLLKYLYIDNNSLTYLPEQLNLPQLQSISVSQNVLTTLPKQLALLPLINKIEIQNNSFVSLPIEFNSIANINLELSEKKRLLDYEYKGADGLGLVDIENSIYLAKFDDSLSEQLRDSLKNSVLEEHQQALQDVALKAVCIETTEEDDYSVCGNTRFGGKPDLPIACAYPEFESSYHESKCGYQFIAQLNCAELVDFQEYLPRSGMLYFFLEDQEGFVCKVIYSDGDELTSGARLNIDEDYIGDDDGIFTPFRAKASNMISIPDFYNGEALFDGTSLENFSDSKQYEEYHQIHDSLKKNLGVKGIYQEWNDCFYADRHHAINTYVFTQHESPQEQAASVKKGNTEDWLILLKVHSDNNCGFCFWDAGEISFVIHKSDLAKCDFSNVMCTLETS